MPTLTTIDSVPAAELDHYSTDAYDAILNADGTYRLVPVAWRDQAEFLDYAYGCGEE